jgi:DNA phosphorothioation-dependent restriction protein DptH
MSNQNATQQIYNLDDATLAAEYVEALSKPLRKFLLSKSSGHCQRLDFLPRPVMGGLAEKLSGDAELVDARVVVRMVSDQEADLQPWEVSGSGAVKLREAATYGQIAVFCALFPTGIRLAEEDSLNIATFKTDDAESFAAERTLEAHLNGKVNLLPEDEKNILRKVLEHDVVRKGSVRGRLRYVLSVLGQRKQSGKSINWELAGAYLYELSLIPDFGLTEGILLQQIARNHQCMVHLTDGERSLGQNVARLTDYAELQDEKRRRELMVYLTDKRVLRTDEWLPAICHDEKVRKCLSFDEWSFAQSVTGLKVELKPLKDPKSGKTVPGILEKNGALTSDGKKAITIKWTVSPPDHEELGKFRITVVRNTLDEGEIDVIPPQFVSAKRKSFAVPIDENTLAEDEQSVVVVRIQALTKTGLPFHDASDDSEEFWVENGEEIEEQPKERGERIRHLDEIHFNAVYSNGKNYEVRNRGWDAKRGHLYSVRLTNNKRGDLLMVPLLLDLERLILAEPGNLGIYEANLLNKRLGKIEDFKEKTPSPAASQVADDFYQARANFFGAVRSLEEGSGVVEIADLHEMSSEVIAYVQSYLELLEALRLRIDSASGPSAVNNVLADYEDLLRIDTVYLQVGPVEKPMGVVLLAPTHPLRVLWLYQYETLVRGWITGMEGRKPDEIRKIIDESVLDKILSLNIPSAIAWSQGKAYINTDNIGLFWGIYPDGTLPDLRSSVNAVLQGVGANTTGGEISTVTPKLIADKIVRYLCHHPYVQTLKINVINPGDGQILLEAIKVLLTKELYEDLNFDVKFFSPKGTRHQLVATAFDDFMNQRSREDWSYGATLSATEERLLSPNENPLFPKLIYGKYTIDELLNEDNEDGRDRFSANLTLLIDFFGTTVSVRSNAHGDGSSSLHNLLAEFLTDYQAGKSTATWSRMIVPSRCNDLVSDGFTGHLFQAHEDISHEAACFFEKNKSLGDYITVQLELTDEKGKNHLRTVDRVHEVSDWVFTIDRNFSIEYFDDPIQGPGSGGGGYLIDYTPEFLDGVAHRLIISTYHQQEIESILRQGFFDLLGIDVNKTGEIVDTAKVADVLRLLKSVSGRLALKLINNPNQAQEVIGLALTRLALERTGRLKGRVIVPVDSHIGLFHQTLKELENSELTLKRTDLMLVELRGRKLHIDLIEVKNRKTTSPSSLVELNEAIRAKNDNTEKHFRQHFLGGNESRLDSLIKNQELATILKFYYERACRYMLFDDVEADSQQSRVEFHKGLEAVSAGVCEVSFAHEGFIFNGSAFFDVEEAEIHGNTIRTYGKVGISNLLGVSMPNGASENDDYVDSTSVTSEFPTPSPLILLQPKPLLTIAGEPVESHDASEKIPVEPQVDEIDSLPESIVDQSVAGLSGQSPKVEPEVSVLLGKNKVTGGNVVWAPYTANPKRLLNQHLLIVGKSGAGKSETTKSMLYELDRLGVPSIIFDFQGEYASGDFKEAVNPQIFDVMAGLPINPFEIPLDPLTGQRKRPVEMMFQLADTLDAVFPGSGDIQLGKLREAIKECYVQKGFNPQLPAPVDKEPPTLEMLSAVLDQWAVERGGQVKNLQVRLQPLFESGIFSQGKAGFSFDDLFKKTTVILLTASIKDLMLAASRFLLERIYSAMMMKGTSKNLRLMVCVDEAHKLCNDPKITDLAKEARKYGLGLLLSSQETRDFHPSIFANAGTQIVLALEDADAGVMSKVFASDKSQQPAIKKLIMEQESGEALIRSTHFEPFGQVRVRSFEDRIES